DDCLPCGRARRPAPRHGGGPCPPRGDGRRRGLRPLPPRPPRRRRAHPRPARSTVQAMTVRAVCIVGPTASGKTAIALEPAARFGAEIVSADSRHIYRGLDVATA